MAEWQKGHAALPRSAAAAQPRHCCRGRRGTAAAALLWHCCCPLVPGLNLVSRAKLFRDVLLPTLGCLAGCCRGRSIAAAALLSCSQFAG